MDQSKYNNQEKPTQAATQIELPARSLSLEFWVGIFFIIATACAGYLAIGLGDLRIFESNRYAIVAEFDNVSGLKHGASVEIAGVPIGEVSRIELRDPSALVHLSINNTVQLRDDDIASIRTKGIIGDRYVKVSRGASDIHIAPGGKLIETESVVDFEDIVGKIVHSLGADKDESKETVK
jgi:phospholipid/cholesterol/gamma-HCH transport system substrate-binding protein